MKIIVCIKQVPSSNDAKVDPVTGVMIRSSADAKLNPYDLFAIETALQIASRVDNASVTAVTMGPPSAISSLKECIDIGLGGGVLVSDRAFAGSDVLATSYTLSQAIQRLQPDLIVCGKQTTDGDTAQVGAELSEFLLLPCIANVNRIDEVKADSLTVTTILGDCEQTVKVPLPVVITVEKDIFTPRLPSYKRQRSLNKEGCITTLSLSDLQDTDRNHYGLLGSATQVEKIFPPQSDNQRVIYDGEDCASVLLQILEKEKYL